MSAHQHTSVKARFGSIWPVTLLCLGLISPTFTLAAPAGTSSTPKSLETNELAALKTEIQQLKKDYHSRIEALEKRLSAAESRLHSQPSTTGMEYAGATATNTSSRSANAFNPAISLIMDGRYVDYASRPGTGRLPGFRYHPEYGLDAEGFNIGESELTMSANIDDKFYAQATIAFGNDNGETQTEVEEAYIQSTALSHGLTAKLGRYYSALGYINEQHPHAWDFADLPLAYSALLGGNLKNEGMQLNWLLPTDHYWEMGIEMGNGGHFPAAGNHNGLSSQTAFITSGGDIGISHSWQAGLSWWHGKSRESLVNNSPWLFSGDTYLNALDVVYKWAPMGNNKEENFKFQFEYLRSRDSGTLSSDGDQPQPYTAQRQGWYAQAIWQFRPLWRTGLRYDRVHAAGQNGESWPEETNLTSSGHHFSRVSAMLEWIPSEFSRLRLQYNDAISGGYHLPGQTPFEDSKWTFQYTVSMGSHGAHQY